MNTKLKLVTIEFRTRTGVRIGVCFSIRTVMRTKLKLVAIKFRTSAGVSIGVTGIAVVITFIHANAQKIEYRFHFNRLCPPISAPALRFISKIHRSKQFYYSVLIIYETYAM